MPSIETPRILIRSLAPADVEPLVALWRDPDVTRYMGGPRDEEAVRATLQQDAADPHPPAHDLWPVIERETGRLVGHCGLLDKEVDGVAEVELVYVFARSAWGKGYATEAGAAVMRYAFGELGLRRLISLIDPQNDASERVAGRLGMALERETIRPGGKRMRVYAATDDALPSAS